MKMTDTAYKIMTIIIIIIIIITLAPFLPTFTMHGVISAAECPMQKYENKEK
jgi:hypothetical protein